MALSPEQKKDDFPKRSVYSPYDLSQLFRVDEHEVLEWITAGKIDFFKIAGDHLRVTAEAVQQFIEKNNFSLPPNWNDPPEKFRVLVVEDDFDMLEIIGELLKDIEEVEVAMESSGFSAALKIASWHPDIILLDFVMPGMDGFEVCKQLRKNHKTRDIPVVAITSLSTIENRRAVVDSGVSVFLGKPFQADRMLLTVRDMLGISSRN